MAAATPVTTGGTVLARGAASVIQFEILPRRPRSAQPQPWPEWPAVRKTDYGQEEAIASRGPIRGFIASLHGIHRRRAGRDRGRHRTGELGGGRGRTANACSPSGTEKRFGRPGAVAMGFLGPEDRCCVHSASRRGAIAVRSGKKSLCRRHAHGQSLVVWAVREGRRPPPRWTNT